jgi:murein L,D-transpeptidase YafK
MRRIDISAPSACPGALSGLSPSHHRFALLAVALLMLAGLAACATAPPQPLKADRVVVKKAERKLFLMKGGKVLQEYRVALGGNPYGPKMEEGDGRTPEGAYVLDWRNPHSNYYKAIHVSYPNEQDLYLARAMGVSPGGMIMIHGMPSYIRSPAILKEYHGRDWTNGCIAVTDKDMDQIWRLVSVGTPILIMP